MTRPNAVEHAACNSSYYGSVGCKTLLLSIKKEAVDPDHPILFTISVYTIVFQISSGVRFHN